MSKSKHHKVKIIWKFVLIVVMVIMLLSSLAPYFAKF